MRVITVTPELQPLPTSAELSTREDLPYLLQQKSHVIREELFSFCMVIDTINMNMKFVCGVYVVR